MPSESMLNGERSEGSNVQLLDVAFRDQVAEHGCEPALMDEKGFTTFSQLDDQSTLLACALKDTLDIGDKRPVILAMSPSVERFGVILALLKLRVPYVPVETSVPKSRVKVIIREVRPVGIVFDSSLTSAIHQSDMFVEGIPLILFSNLKDSAAKMQNTKLPASTGDEDPDCLACILYTSGSTGVPKGVQLSHRNIMVRLAWQWRKFPFKGSEIGMAKTSLLFVDSITESWSFLLQGRPVVITRKDQVKNPEKLIDTLQQFRVSRLLVVPSLLHSILTYVGLVEDTDLSALEMVICSGESLPVHLARKFFQVFDDKVLVNLYGSTEITGDATYEVFCDVEDVSRKSFDGAMSIGTPLDNLKIKLVDDQFDAVAVGEVGEIWIQGDTVTRGYVNESHNEGALVVNDEGTWYASGDYGKILNNAIIYQGRRDSQVKIRGNRVNLMEIEKCILSIDGVEKVCILVIDDNIVAFCATKTTCTEIEIREVCASKLPEYMVPHVYLMEEIPLTESTGKTDRVKLRDLYKNRRTSSNMNNDTKKSDPILEIIAKEIGVEKINLEDNFYELGGNSVNVVSVAAKLNEIGFRIDFQKFLKATSVREMMQTLTIDVEDSGEVTPFDILPLDGNSPREDIIRLLSETFSTKEAVTALCKISMQEFVYFMDKLFYDPAIRSGASGVMYRNDELIGVVFNMDDEDLPDFESVFSDLPSSLQTLVKLLELTEKPLVEVKGKSLEMSISAVKSGLNGAESLIYMHELELFTLEKAKELGYQFVKSVNSSPVTQAFARSIGYETKAVTRMKDFEHGDGSRPFQHAPDDVTLHSSFKRL